MKRNIVIAVILILFLNIFIVTVYYSLTSNINLFDYILKRNKITKEEKEYLREKKVLIYGSDRSSPPLRYVDPDSGQYRGLVVDYVNALSIELGIEIKMEPLIWSKALEKLEFGETDFSDMFRSKERADKFLFSNQIYNLRGIIVTSSNNTSINTLSDLEDKTVALPAGDFAIDFLKARNPSQKFLFTRDNFAALEMVRDGFADAVVGDEPVLSFYMKKLEGLEILKILQEPAYEQDCVFGISKKDKILVGIMNKGINNLKSKGMMLKIQQKWLGVTAGFVQTRKAERILLILLIFTTLIILGLYIFSQLNKTLKREIFKRTEELNLSRNELRITFDGLTHLMATYNEKCEIVNVNKSFIKFIGISPDKIMQKHCFSLEKQFFKNCSDCIVKKTFNNNEIFKKEYSDKGSIYELSSYPIELHKSEVQKVLLMVKDITTEKITEEKYFQENKMAAIGQLAAGMAHEIRNPLGLIRNYSYLLKHSTDQNDPQINKSIIQIESSVEKAGSIIDNLLNFSRLDNEDNEKIYIRDFVDEILQLEKKLMHRLKIKYVINCSPDISYMINREVLKHIVINLTSNAIDAMTDGGQLTVNGEVIENNFVLKFSDTGSGIPKGDRDSIFNPFFTTKKRGKGTGLGLYIVYSDIKRYGGEITVFSEVGRGTIFSVTLPFDNGVQHDSV
jgi:PAS domain S-box-containing protein